MSTKTGKRYMSAAQAYEQAARRVEHAAGVLAIYGRKELTRAINQFDLLADAFEKYPETWTIGTYASKADHTVCSVGMLHKKYRKDAGLTDKLADVPSITGKLVLVDFIISLNDALAGGYFENDEHRYVPRSTMGPKNIVRVYRIIADGLRQVLALKEQGKSVKSDDVVRLVCGPLNRAATKAAWNSKNKIALVK